MPAGPIRIFVGTEEKTKVPFDVLSSSIKKWASVPVKITPMIGPKWTVPKGLHQGTGFSLRRFMIPAACNFEGFAIYLDADQLLFSDIAELWEYANLLTDKRSAGCTYQTDKFSLKNPWPQSSVMIIDCANCGWVPEEIWNLLKGGYLYHDLMHLMFMRGKDTSKPIDDFVLRIPNYWNHLNTYEDTVTRLLHYTKEPEQPWYKPEHSLAGLWETALGKAIANGEVSKADFVAGLKLWHSPKIDKRPKQGLNPYYERYLPKFK